MLILASQSPRRQELLRLITPDFEVLPADVDETTPNGTGPKTVVEFLARIKAEAVAAKRPGDVIIGADTIVELDGEIFGKPNGDTGAALTLERLSGKTHTVRTGVCIISPDVTEVFSQATRVAFRSMTAREIYDYIATGEPHDKAGAYGIQGRAALFIRSIEGDYCNVMGLPVAELYARLKRLGIVSTQG